MTEMKTEQAGVTEKEAELAEITQMETEHAGMTQMKMKLAGMTHRGTTNVRQIDTTKRRQITMWLYILLWTDEQNVLSFLARGVLPTVTMELAFCFITLVGILHLQKGKH